MEVKAYGTHAEDKPLIQMNIPRRKPTDNDVHIDIHYCGVCHSDIHYVENDWGGAKYPAVPGHEIVGVVKAVGKNVKNFKEGDKVGVGCMVDSCQSCKPCKDNLEQFCEKGSTQTYGSKDKHIEGQHTFGGYSEEIVVDEKFVLSVSEKLDFKKVAPLLCAGITTYSPLKHWKVKKGDKVGIIGLGGLGHMGVKLAHSMGAHVVMITRSPGKSEDAKSLGADAVLISKDDDEMKKHFDSFDFLLNTIPVGHDMNPYIKLLKVDGTMVLVGAIEDLDPMNGAHLITRRKSVAGSLIGGIKETQEMLDFCAENGVHPDVEMIDIDNINSAFKRVKDSDVKYRFVIDMKSLS